MKRVLYIISAIVVLGTFAACHKTPESPIVVGKDQTIMLEKAEETLPPEIGKLPLTERYAVKEHLEKTVTELDDALVIEVDADISVPAAEGVPVVSVKPADFSQETVYALFDALCGDTRMYKGRSEYSKAEIDDSLVMLKKELAEAEDEDTRLNIQDIISDLESRYADAPMSISDTPADGTLSEREETVGGDVYLGMATAAAAVEYPHMPYGYRGKWFSVYNNSDQSGMIEYELDGRTKKLFPSYQASLEYSEERLASAAWAEYWSCERRAVKSSEDMSAAELETAGLTPGQAAEQAEALFTEAQIPLYIDYIIYVDAEKPFYDINCSRQINGVNIALGGEGTGGDGVAPYWAYEMARMFVSSDGIIYFHWYSPYEQTGTEIENATLMPFGDIEDIFYKMMKTVYAPAAKDENGTVIEVTDISLKLQRIKRENSDTEGLLIPVWCFYGTRRVDESIENEEMTSDWERGYTPLLIVNAIDGSIIDRGLGY